MKKAVRFAIDKVPRRHIHRVMDAGRAFTGILYAGKGMHCPVCGKNFRKFMPYGYGDVRDNALCPGCMSLERHRLMWLYMTRETDFFRSTPKVLHIAPERCFMKRLGKMLGGDYITADLESPLAKVKMDIQDIPFEDNSFDVVLCNHVLEHIEDDRKAMREMFRVMRPGGWGIMLVPLNPQRETTYEDASITSPEARKEAFRQYDHVRDYGLDYPDRLAEAGFEVEAINYASGFPPEEAAKYSLGCDTLFVVRKPAK